MDANSDGSVTRQELEAMLKGLGSRMPDSEIQDMINKADKNGDGKICFCEFVTASQGDQAVQDAKAYK